MVVTGAENRIFHDGTGSRADGYKAVTALMVIDWAPDLAREIGPRMPNMLPRRINGDISHPDERRAMRDLIAHSAGQPNPSVRLLWEIWQRQIARFYLRGNALIGGWVSCLYRIGSKEIRTPGCLPAVGFNELILIDWHVPKPDILVRLWKADKQDREPLSGGRPLYAPGTASGRQALISSMRHEHLKDTETIREYAGACSELNAPSNFD